MSKEANIALHKMILAKARLLPIASDRRMGIISRSIQGIIRAMRSDYNPQHL